MTQLSSSEDHVGAGPNRVAAPGDDPLAGAFVEVIGLDGDDTLWHNESIFAAIHDRFRALVGRYAPDADIDARLLATERRNLDLFGYGVKGFALSMIETAIAVTDRQVGAEDLHEIVMWAKEMLSEPVDLLEGVPETVALLAERYRLVLITKGDFFHQETKVARSGLAGHFEAVEIVAEKDAETYRGILRRRQVDPSGFVMVGNSVRSDVLPVLAIGGHAVHVPYHLTWAHEAAEAPPDGRPYAELPDIRDLPALLTVGQP